MEKALPCQAPPGFSFLLCVVGESGKKLAQLPSDSLNEPSLLGTTVSVHERAASEMEFLTVTCSSRAILGGRPMELGARAGGLLAIQLVCP